MLRPAASEGGTAGAQSNDARVKRLLAQRAAKKGSITKRINAIDRLVSEGGSRRKLEYLLSSLLDVFVSLQQVCEELSERTSEQNVEWHAANEAWL